MHSTSRVGTGFEVSDCSRIVINKLNAKLNNYTDLFFPQYGIQKVSPVSSSSCNSITSQRYRLFSAYDRKWRHLSRDRDLKNVTVTLCVFLSLTTWHLSLFLCRCFIDVLQSFSSFFLSFFFFSCFFLAFLAFIPALTVFNSFKDE